MPPKKVHDQYPCFEKDDEGSFSDGSGDDSMDGVLERVWRGAADGERDEVSLGILDGLSDGELERETDGAGVDICSTFQSKPTMDASFVSTAPNTGSIEIVQLLASRAVVSSAMNVKNWLDASTDVEKSRLEPSSNIEVACRSRRTSSTGVNSWLTDRRSKLTAAKESSRTG